MIKWTAEVNCANHRARWRAPRKSPAGARIPGGTASALPTVRRRTERSTSRRHDDFVGSEKGWSFVGGRANSRSGERYDLSRHSYSSRERAKTAGARLHWHTSGRAQPDLATGGVELEMMSQFEALR